MDNADNNDTLLARWLAGELSEEELAAFQQREDFAELQRIVEDLKGLAPPAFSDTEAWERLRAKRDAPAEAAPSPTLPSTVRETPVYRLPMRQVLAIAAAVLALVALGWWLFSDEGTILNQFDQQYTTTTGEQLEVELPDGSTATLNAKSTLAFSQKLWPGERNVELSGEAYFKAKKGKTFTVIAEQGQAQVVGTRFNVFARGTELEVKCTEGKVQVSSPNKERALIKAGEQVSVLNGRMQKRQGLEGYPKWFEGESRFQHKTAAFIFDELERQYGITVLDEQMDDKTYTARFPHGNLDQAVQNLCRTMRVQCAMTGDTLRVQ